MISDIACETFSQRVPMWHPADSCSGRVKVPESTIQLRPYRETRLRS